MRRAIESSIKIDFWKKRAYLKSEVITIISFILIIAYLIIRNFSDYKIYGGLFNNIAGLLIPTIIIILVIVFRQPLSRFHENRSLRIKRSLKTGKWEYDPKQLMGRISWDRNKGMKFSASSSGTNYCGCNNVILIIDKKGWARIFGVEERLILEIGLWNGRDYQVFHMIKREFTDTVIPLLAEEKNEILENSYSEFFPVKKSWIIDNNLLHDFLTKLYEVQDLETAMQDYLFEDNTELICRLRKKKAYIVPMGYVFDADETKEIEKWHEGIEDKCRIALEELVKE